MTEIQISRSPRLHLVLALVAVAASAGPAPGQDRSIVGSPHNLSASGPGAVRAASEQEICIFCHTPHRASPIQPLWNRYQPVAAYGVYASSALDATPDQPTGSSKMCLSCHDGTIALGSVVSRNQTIQMAGGITTIPPGASNLGTDLSDDHPISIRYDSSLVALDRNLVPAGQIPEALGLDENQEIQCITCHDAHDNAFGDFLVMSNEASAMCRSCHVISSTTVTGHSDCAGCHQPHSAPSGPFLLVEKKPTGACLSCHDGSHPEAWNIAADMNRISVHDTDSPVDPPDRIPGHATCADCHDPHTMEVGVAIPPGAPPNFGRVRGVNASGTPVASAGAEYEVCFKCHADQNAIGEPWIQRWITQVNTRFEFDLSAVSFHPIEGPGRSMDVPSLRPPYTEASVIYCTDCHASDTGGRSGGSGPDGPHGSHYRPLLAARYETRDFTVESADAYALCYKCHYRSGARGILTDASFPHELHVRDERTPCSVCHDAHGIASGQGNFLNNSHLINFDRTVVSRHPFSGRLEYVDTGTFSGTCTLVCHGEVHSNEAYPDD